MIEIWTEDSTVGYSYLVWINRLLFDRQYKIVKHNGVGFGPITTKCKYGGILKHLKVYNDKSLVLLLVDKAIDKKETKEYYFNILNEIKKHNNIFFIKAYLF